MDTWLLEHSERVMRICLSLAILPELRADPPDPAALATAAWFHDVGWAVQYRAGDVPQTQVLARPTSDGQREQAVNELTQRCGSLLIPEVLGLACEAIRQCNLRNASLPEAQVLADAENLDEIGMIYVLRQFRQNLPDGRGLKHLLQNWTRQRQYHYWEARIERLRFRVSRQLAHQRLAEIERWMTMLQAEIQSADLAAILTASGLTPPAIFGPENGDPPSAPPGRAANPG